MERDDGIVVTALADMKTSDSPHALYHVIHKGEEVFGLVLRQLLRPKQRSQGHRHKSPEVFFVVRGTLTLITEGDEIVAPAGTAVFIPSGVAHAVKNPSGSEETINIILMAAGYQRGTEATVEL